MRQRAGQRLTDAATIRRREETGTNALGEPITEETVVAEGEPCAYSPSGTSFVREDSGERVQRPATVRFLADVDVREGDTIDVDAVPATHEVRGVENVRDLRRGRSAYQRVEVERA